MHRRRARAIKALLGSIPILAVDPRLQACQQEFDEIHLVHKVRSDLRRRLLEVFHAARAIDSTLAIFVTGHGCRDRKGRAVSNLGGYLVALREHSVPTLRRITGPQKRRFKKRITDPRNRYIHIAGSRPSTDQEVVEFVAEVAACVAVVSRL